MGFVVRFHFSSSTLPLLYPFVRHVNHKSINGYAEFRTEANASVCRNRRNASCPGRCLRQQRAKRARVPLQRRVRIPFEDGRDHRFFWCVPTIWFLKRIQGHESVMISASLAAAMGATFAATESIVANQREKQDALNGVAGGCAAGFLAGIRGAHHHTFLVPFRANILCSSFPADSRCFLRGDWGCSGDVRHCWSIITRRSGGAVV